METAISTTRLHSPSLAGIFIIPSQSFIHSSCYAMPPSSYSHACHFFHTRRQTALMRAFPGYLLQPCVTFSTVPSSEVCTFNLRKTQNKQQPGQFFSSSYSLLGKVSCLLFLFALSDVPVGVVVHGRHISWLDYAVLFWEIGFGKGLVW